MSFHRSSSYGDLLQDPYYTDGETYKYVTTFQDEPSYRIKSARRSRSRTRSASPDRLVGRMSRMGLDEEFEYYDDEPKPPFVVRHVDSNKLIGRTPGTIGPNERRRTSRSAGRMRATQVYGPGSSGYYKNGYTSLDDDYVVHGRTPITQPMTSRNYSYYSDEDRVGYDDDYVATKYGRRIRAASPVNYRRPLSERFEDGLTPRYSDHISHSVDHALRRNRYDNPARLHSSYTKSYLGQELEDLKVDLELARTRRAIEDEEWDRRRMFPGISRVPHHRDQFNHKLYNSYSDMYAAKTRPFYS